MSARGRASSRPRVYVVTAPPSARGIYETWEACKAAVTGAAGARYQAVSGRAAAEALLRGEPIRLPPGRFAFVDGNAMGGIGVVLVEQGDGEPAVREELGTTVYDVFRDRAVPSLDARPKITEAANRLRNVLAELGGLFAALELAPAGSALTVVHDYAGVGAWMERRWRTKDPLVAEIIAACRQRAAARRLTLTFHHQRGHESTAAGRNDFAAFNARADRLATDAAFRDA